MAAQSLIQFLRAAGGIKDTGGDLGAMGFAKYQAYVRIGAGNGTTSNVSRGLINNETGLDPDHAREIAAEAGYMGYDIENAMASTTVSDLLELLDHGGSAFSIYDESEMSAKQARIARREFKLKMTEAREAVRCYLSKHGAIHDDSALVEIAADFYMDDGDMEAAVDSACIALESAPVEDDESEFEAIPFDSIYNVGPPRVPNAAVDVEIAAFVDRLAGELDSIIAQAGIDLAERRSKFLTAREAADENRLFFR